jgi:hypothetical protein
MCILDGSNINHIWYGVNGAEVDLVTACSVGHGAFMMVSFFCCF